MLQDGRKAKLLFLVYKKNVFCTLFVIQNSSRAFPTAILKEHEWKNILSRENMYYT